MIRTIVTKFMDILFADAGLLTNSPTNFAGVKYIRTSSDDYRRDYVNVVPHAYEQGDRSRRPAIFTGQQGNTVTDISDPDNKTTVGPRNNANYYRLLTLPIVVVHIDADPLVTETVRDQIMSNIKKIMMNHITEDGYWWLLEQGSEIARITPTGGGQAGLNEAFGMCNFNIHYIQNSTITVP